MQIIKINSDQRNIGNIGFSREHRDITLEISLPEKIYGCDIYDAEFEMECGDKYTLHNIEVKDNVAVVPLECEVLKFGKLYIQLVGYKAEPRSTTKSDFYIGFVKRSINAAEEEITEHTPLINQLYEDMEDLRKAVGEVAILETDDSLKLVNGKLSVNTTSEVNEDNTLPITSAAVATQVGNIEVLLNTI